MTQLWHLESVATVFITSQFTLHSSQFVLAIYVNILIKIKKIFVKQYFSCVNLPIFLFKEQKYFICSLFYFLLNN